MNTTIKVTSHIVLVAVAAFAVAITACDRGGDEAPKTPSPVGGASPTVTAEAVSMPKVTPTTVTEPTVVPETPAPPSESNGMDGFRTFAQQVEQAIANRDAQFFIDRARLTEFTCPGEPGMAPAACDGQPAGTVIQGIQVGYWRSEGQMVRLEEYPQWLDSYFGGGRRDLNDAYGNGSVALYALAQGPEGLEFSAVTTYIADDNPDVTGYYEDPTRESRMFEFRFEDGRWQLVHELVELGRPEWAWGEQGPRAPEWLAGDCTVCYDYWERWEGAP